MSYDLVTVGRDTMDLLAQDIGMPFDRVTGFHSSVGGSPTNIAIASARLGSRALAFTGVGDDLVGDYVLRFLRDEGVGIDHIPRKTGKQTALALVAIEPPDRFPLTFYREDPADIYLTPSDAASLPFDESAALLLSGNAFSRGTCVDAARYCGERGADAGLTIYMDLDLRPTEWSLLADYGRTLRRVLPLVDVLIGTEEEFYAALAPDPEAVVWGQLLGEVQREQLHGLLEGLIADRVVETIVIKRGAHGATVVSMGERSDAPGFAVEAVNTIGAGDAFAAGLIHGRLVGWDWYRSARFANACGAIQVTRHGCSSAFATKAEVDTFLEEHGGI